MDLHQKSSVDLLLSHPPLLPLPWKKIGVLFAVLLVLTLSGTGINYYMTVYVPTQQAKAEQIMLEQQAIADQKQQAIEYEKQQIEFAKQREAAKAAQLKREADVIAAKEKFDREQREKFEAEKNKAAKELEEMNNAVNNLNFDD